MANRLGAQCLRMPIDRRRYRYTQAMGMDMLKRWLARRALNRIMRPDPEYRSKRLAQFSKERQERYWRNVQAALHPDQN